MVLREFLYVDTDKVRGMLAQLDGGIPEQERTATRTDRSTDLGLRGYIGHGRVSGEETHLDKSLGDALFPNLEEALESEGLLQDISEALADPAYWTSGLRSEHQLGNLVRITSPGSLFDSRYVAESMAAFATIWSGLGGLGIAGAGTSAARRSSGGSSSRGQGKSRKPDAPGMLEDAIPDIRPMEGGGTSLSAEFLRSIVMIARGMFRPGLHLNLSPARQDEHSIGVRLQEGRQFLDSDTEVLFARYGTGFQEWTVVGTIGHYSGSDDLAAPSFGDIVADGGNVSRSRMLSNINRLMQYVGSLGFSDMPQYPGFSVVPLAVYRSIPRIGADVR